MAPTLTCAANLQRATAGPYPVYNCNGHNPTISVLIETLQTTLQSVLNDLSQYRSTAAYTTFFKHVSFASDVHDIYSNIMLGTPVAPGPHAIKYPPPGSFGVPRNPQFICVTAREQVTWSLEQGGLGGRQSDAYTACENSPIQAFGIFGTKYLQNTIVLCPAFWKWLAIPSSSQSACLPVDPHFNRFRSDGNRLVNYQLWVLLHELAHVYIYAKSGNLYDVSSPNDCALLSGNSAINNAQNYVYYAASKSVLMTLPRCLQCLIDIKLAVLTKAWQTFD